MIKFDIVKKLSRDFQPRYFNSNSIENLLKENENKVIIVLRSDDNKSAYETFDSDFSAYLEKLPASPLKKYVGQLFNKNLIFFGVAKNSDGTTISRILLTKNEKLAGIVLNSYALDISISKGETPQIDEAIYAAYSGIIRAASIVSKQEIKKDYEFHRLISSYIYLLFLKILGKHISITPQQKDFLQLTCGYLFYRQFLEEKHSGAIKQLSKHFVGEIVSKESFEESKYKLEKLIPFTSFKDMPRIVQDLNIASISPQQTLMLIIKAVDKSGFYSLIGSLDSLLSIVVLSRYPTELVARGIMVNSDLQGKIENKIEKYIDNLSYEDEFSNVLKK